VRAYAPDEIAGGVMATDLKVILSPTGLNDAAWIAAQTDPAPSAGFSIDRRLPKIGEKAIINGRVHNIQGVMPIRVNDTLVRIELQVR
jgi:hypothetical protein